MDANQLTSNSYRFSSSQQFSNHDAQVLTRYLQDLETRHDVFIPKQPLLLSLRSQYETTKLNLSHRFDKPLVVKEHSISGHRFDAQLDNLPLKLGRQVVEAERDKLKWLIRHCPEVTSFILNSSNQHHKLLEELLTILGDEHVVNADYDTLSKETIKSVEDKIKSVYVRMQVADAQEAFQKNYPGQQIVPIDQQIEKAVAANSIKTLRKTSEFNQCRFAVISKQNNSIHISSDSEMSKMMLGLLIEHHNIQLPEDFHSAAVMINVRDMDSFKQTFEKIINHFRVTQKVPIMIKDDVYDFKFIKESHAYSFLESLITMGTAEASTLNEPDSSSTSTKDCLEELLQSHVWEFQSSDQHLEAALNKALRQDSPSLFTKLAAIQAFSLHYAEQVDLKEVIKSLLLGALIGGGGETIIEHALHDTSKMTQTVLRMMLFVLIDTIDNALGELGTLSADLSGMGLKLTKKDIFNADGPLSIAQKMIKFPGFFLDLLIKGDAPGQAGLPVAIALRSAVGAALIGLALNYWPASVYSDEHANIAKLMGATLLSVYGTSLSIPINLILTLPRAMAAVHDHAQQNRIILPPDVSNLIDTALEDITTFEDFNGHPESETAKKLHKEMKSSMAAAEQAYKLYLLKQAVSDLTSRIGFSASIKAFSSIWTLSLLWLFRHAGAPRSVIQPIIMSVSPAMENLFRFMYTAIAAFSFPMKIETLNQKVIAAEQQHKQFTSRDLRHQMTGAVTPYLTYAYSALTWPLQHLLSVQGKLVSPLRVYPKQDHEEMEPPVEAASYMTGIETMASNSWSYLRRRKAHNANGDNIV